MKYTTILNLVAALSLAYGIAFDGPAPTNISPHRALIQTNPRPTEGPSVEELKKRQTGSSAETCGWVDGDFDSAVACSVGRTCMLYKSASYGMAGCCAGRDTQECAWAYSCVDRSSYMAGSCGSSCILDTFVRKCTNALAPYCVTWTYAGDGVADYGCDSTSHFGVLTVRKSATDTVGDTTSTSLPTIAVGGVIISTPGSSSGGGSGSGSGSGTGNSTTTSRKTAKKLAIGTIIGIVIAVLFLLFFVIIAVFMSIKKKKKNQQIANNAQIVANAQANRPQSQYQPPQPPPQQMQQPGGTGFVPPMPPQSPQPTVNGFFSPPAQQEQKYGHTSVHEYAATPISNPPTPAPAYNQPYGSPVVSPLMPQQQYQPPTNGAFEAPAHVGVSRAPQPVVSLVQQHSSPVVAAHEVEGNKPGPVYEMGQGK
ncbi:hypothetical protein EK21DRAFT_100025 [Setomelanomma holmii]|uniref:Uncharacterized protein n=1 Tax=Setomelanomma holmii TaxID=210430 RepID=A0A9P4HAL5_9PLEO|nr:hypothetical protein EK21DRAFT_100025 [Setomelanomma holmii]